MSDPLDVTGSWDGIFSYPRAMPANGFRCELREHGGAISGETHERSDADHDQGETILALIEGTRDGQAVRFTKRYDDLARAHYAVSYSGTLADDGDEITGRWEIAGVWAGSFIMTRRSRRGVAAEARTTETVR